MSDRKVNTTAKVLIEAKKLIDDPKHWGKKKYEQTKAFTFADRVEYHTQYCMAGALRKATKLMVYSGQLDRKDTTWDCYTPAIRMIEEEVTNKGANSVPGFNDNPMTRHKHVLEVFDTVITKALSG